MVYMGEHMPHVDWELFEKKIGTKCPRGINKGTITHYL
jgi:hypothetical protein